MKSEEEDTIQLRVNQGKFIPLDEFQEIRRKASLVFGNVFGIPDRLAYFGREREPDEIKDKDRPCLITADPKIKKNTCLILVAPGSRKNNERRPFIRLKVNKYDEDVRTFFLLNLQWFTNISSLKEHWYQLSRKEKKTLKYFLSKV